MEETQLAVISGLIHKVIGAEADSGKLDLNNAANDHIVM
jgi:hypothetical protein